MSQLHADDGFHGYRTATAVGDRCGPCRPDTEFTYTFENFFHPFVGELIEQLNRESLPGCWIPSFHARPDDADFFDDVLRRR